MELNIDQIIEKIFQRAAGDPSLSWASGTTMPAEAFGDFIKTNEDTSLLMKDVQRAGHLVTFGGDSYKVPLLGLADRQLQKATVNVAPTTIPTFSTGKAEIEPTEVILPINIPYGSLEDAIGKTAAEAGNIGANAKVDQAIGDLAMVTVANDLEDLILNGDTLSGTAFLQTFDGAIKLVKATGTKYTPGEAQTVLEWLAGMFNAAPARIRRGAGNAFYVSSEEFSDLWDAYGSRLTTLGDASLTQDQQGQLRFRGLPVKELVSMPAQKGFFGRSGAFWVGFKRQITVERMRNPRARQVELTLTARVGHTEVLDQLVYGERTL